MVARRLRRGRLIALIAIAALVVLALAVVFAEFSLPAADVERRTLARQQQPESLSRDRSMQGLDAHATPSKAQDRSLAEPRLVVFVRDEAGRPLADVAIATSLSDTPVTTTDGSGYGRLASVWAGKQLFFQKDGYFPGAGVIVGENAQSEIVLRTSHDCSVIIRDGSGSPVSDASVAMSARPLAARDDSSSRLDPSYLVSVATSDEHGCAAIHRLRSGAQFLVVKKAGWLVTRMLPQAGIIRVPEVTAVQVVMQQLYGCAINAASLGELRTLTVDPPSTWPIITGVGTESDERSLAARLGATHAFLFPGGASPATTQVPEAALFALSTENDELRMKVPLQPFDAIQVITLDTNKVQPSPKGLVQVRILHPDGDESSGLESLILWFQREPDKKLVAIQANKVTPVPPGVYKATRQGLQYPYAFPDTSLSVASGETTTATIKLSIPLAIMVLSVRSSDGAPIEGGVAYRVTFEAGGKPIAGIANKLPHKLLLPQGAARVSCRYTHLVGESTLTLAPRVDNLVTVTLLESDGQK